MRRGQRSTPAGQHRPVLLEEVLTHLRPGPGAVVADCTIGWAGHAAELLRRAGPAAQLLAKLPEEELRQALAELGDEPEAARIAAAVVAARRQTPLERTSDLARVIVAATRPAGEPWRLHPARHRWELHPAARTFQA